MDWYVIIFGLMVLVGILKAFKIFKIKAINKNMALALIVIGGIGLAWTQGYLQGITLPTVPTTPEVAVTPGVTFEAEGSESDTNLAYDQATRVFTCSFYENTAASKAWTSTSAGSAIDSVTFTITVFRTDISAGENTSVATSKIWAVVPTFYGKDANASVLYWPVDKDATSQKYEVAFTPAGGSARDEYNFFTVGIGGSKAISTVVDSYHTGLCQLDNFQSKDVAIHIYGLTETYTLRYIKIGETA